MLFNEWRFIEMKRKSTFILILSFILSSSLILSVYAETTWTIETLDSAGDVGQYSSLA